MDSRSSTRSSPSSRHIVVYKQFLTYCSKSLDADGPKIMKILEMKYESCSEAVQTSEEMVGLLERTMENMKAEPRRAFVHLKVCVNQLKLWSKVKQLKTFSTAENGAVSETGPQDHNKKEVTSGGKPHSDTRKKKTELKEPESKIDTDHRERKSDTTVEHEENKSRPVSEPDCILPASIYTISPLNECKVILKRSPLVKAQTETSPSRVDGPLPVKSHHVSIFDGNLAQASVIQEADTLYDDRASTSQQSPSLSPYSDREKKSVHRGLVFSSSMSDNSGGTNISDTCNVSPKKLTVCSPSSSKSCLSESDVMLPQKHSACHSSPRNSPRKTVLILEVNKNSSDVLDIQRVPPFHDEPSKLAIKRRALFSWSEKSNAQQSCSKAATNNSQLQRNFSPSSIPPSPTHKASTDIPVDCDTPSPTHKASADIPVDSDPPADSASDCGSRSPPKLPSCASDAHSDESSVDGLADFPCHSKAVTPQSESVVCRSLAPTNLEEVRLDPVSIDSIAKFSPLTSESVSPTSVSWTSRDLDSLHFIDSEVNASVKYDSQVSHKSSHAQTSEAKQSSASNCIKLIEPNSPAAESSEKDSGGLKDNQAVEHPVSVSSPKNQSDTLPSVPIPVHVSDCKPTEDGKVSACEKGTGGPTSHVSQSVSATACEKGTGGPTSQVSQSVSATAWRDTEESKEDSDDSVDEKSECLDNNRVDTKTKEGSVMEEATSIKTNVQYKLSSSDSNKGSEKLEAELQTNRESDLPQSKSSFPEKSGQVPQNLEDNERKEVTYPVSVTRDDLVKRDSPVSVTRDDLVKRDSPVSVNRDDLVKRDSPVSVTRDDLVKRDSPVSVNRHDLVKGDVTVVVDSEDEQSGEESETSEASQGHTRTLSLKKSGGQPSDEGKNNLRWSPIKMFDEKKKESDSAAGRSMLTPSVVIDPCDKGRADSADLSKRDHDASGESFKVKPHKRALLISCATKSEDLTSSKRQDFTSRSLTKACSESKPSTSGSRGGMTDSPTHVSSGDEFASAAVDVGEKQEKLSPEEEKRRRHVGKLEKLLESLRNEIEKCQARELSFEDLDAEDSSYIYEDKLKKKFVAVWNKLCEVTSRTVATGRPTERTIRFNSTRYKEINRKLERFLNKTKNFPDIHDVKQVIKMTNKKYKLNLSSAMMQNIAREAFVDIGEMLQSRRHEDFIATFGNRETDSIRSYGRDPYWTDPELRRKLDSNRETAKSNLEKVITKYTQLQDKRKHGNKDDDDDEDDDGSADEHKTKEKSRHGKDVWKGKKTGRLDTSSEEEEERRSNAETETTALDLHTTETSSKHKLARGRGSVSDSESSASGYSNQLLKPSPYLTSAIAKQSSTLSEHSPTSAPTGGNIPISGSVPSCEEDQENVSYLESVGLLSLSVNPYIHKKEGAHSSQKSSQLTPQKCGSQTSCSVPSSPTRVILIEDSPAKPSPAANIALSSDAMRKERGDHSDHAVKGNDKNRDSEMVSSQRESTDASESVAPEQQAGTDHLELDIASVVDINLKLVPPSPVETATQRLASAATVDLRREDKPSEPKLRARHSIENFEEIEDQTSDSSSDEKSDNDGEDDDDDDIIMVMSSEESAKGSESETSRASTPESVTFLGTGDSDDETSKTSAGTDEKLSKPVKGEETGRNRVEELDDQSRLLAAVDLVRRPISSVEKDAGSLTCHVDTPNAAAGFKEALSTKDSQSSIEQQPEVPAGISNVEKGPSGVTKTCQTLGSVPEKSEGKSLGSFRKTCLRGEHWDQTKEALDSNVNFGCMSTEESTESVITVRGADGAQSEMVLLKSPNRRLWDSDGGQQPESLLTTESTAEEHRRSPQPDPAVPCSTGTSSPRPSMDMAEEGLDMEAPESPQCYIDVDEDEEEPLMFYPDCSRLDTSAASVSVGHMTSGDGTVAPGAMETSSSQGVPQRVSEVAVTRAVDNSRPQKTSFSPAAVDGDCHSDMRSSTAGRSSEGSAVEASRVTVPSLSEDNLVSGTASESGGFTAQGRGEAVTGDNPTAESCNTTKPFISGGEEYLGTSSSVTDLTLGGTSSPGLSSCRNGEGAKRTPQVKNPPELESGTQPAEVSAEAAVQDPPDDTGHEEVSSVEVAERLQDSLSSSVHGPSQLTQTGKDKLQKQTGVDAVSETCSAEISASPSLGFPVECGSRTVESLENTRESCSPGTGRENSDTAIEYGRLGLPRETNQTSLNVADSLDTSLPPGEDKQPLDINSYGVSQQTDSEQALLQSIHRPPETTAPLVKVSLTSTTTNLSPESSTTSELNDPLCGSGETEETQRTISLSAVNTVLGGDADAVVGDDTGAAVAGLMGDLMDNIVAAQGVVDSIVLTLDKAGDASAHVTNFKPVDKTVLGTQGAAAIGSLLTTAAVPDKATVLIETKGMHGEAQDMDTNDSSAVLSSTTATADTPILEAEGQTPACQKHLPPEINSAKNDEAAPDVDEKSVSMTRADDDPSLSVAVSKHLEEKETAPKLPQAPSSEVNTVISVGSSSSRSATKDGELQSGAEGKAVSKRGDPTATGGGLESTGASRREVNVETLTCSDENAKEMVNKISGKDDVGLESEDLAGTLRSTECSSDEADSSCTSKPKDDFSPDQNVVDMPEADAIEGSDAVPPAGGTAEGSGEVEEKRDMLKLISEICNTILDNATADKSSESNGSAGEGRAAARQTCVAAREVGEADSRPASPSDANPLEEDGPVGTGATETLDTSCSILSADEEEEEVSIVEELCTAKGVRVSSRSKEDDRRMVDALLSSVPVPKKDHQPTLASDQRNEQEAVPSPAGNADSDGERKATHSSPSQLCSPAPPDTEPAADADSDTPASCKSPLEETGNTTAPEKNDSQEDETSKSEVSEESVSTGETTTKKDGVHDKDISEEAEIPTVQPEPPAEHVSDSGAEGSTERVGEGLKEKAGEETSERPGKDSPEAETGTTCEPAEREKESGSEQETTSHSAKRKREERSSEEDVSVEKKVEKDSEDEAEDEDLAITNVELVEPPSKKQQPSPPELDYITDIIKTVYREIPPKRKKAARDAGPLSQGEGDAEESSDDIIVVGESLSSVPGRASGAALRPVSVFKNFSSNPTNGRQTMGPAALSSLGQGGKPQRKAGQASGSNTLIGRPSSQVPVNSPKIITPRPYIPYGASSHQGAGRGGHDTGSLWKQQQHPAAGRPGAYPSAASMIQSSRSQARAALSSAASSVRYSPVSGAVGSQGLPSLKPRVPIPAVSRSRPSTFSPHLHPSYSPLRGAGQQPFSSQQRGGPRPVASSLAGRGVCQRAAAAVVSPLSSSRGGLYQRPRGSGVVASGRPHLPSSSHTGRYGNPSPAQQRPRHGPPPKKAMKNLDGLKIVLDDNSDEEDAGARPRRNTALPGDTVPKIVSVCSLSKTGNPSALSGTSRGSAQASSGGQSNSTQVPAEEIVLSDSD